MAKGNDLEKRIKKLKEKVTVERKAAKEGAAGAPISLRTVVKKLKRAQRRKRSLLVRAASVAAKGKKKENEKEKTETGGAS
ncbi:MAG: hypothetical protein WAO55_02715 [Candidatus Manganitrophaceae bacterium]